MKNIDWNNVQEMGDFPKPTPGGYIVRIVAVEDEEKKEYLRISYDFAEGDLKGYYKDLMQAMNFWGGTFIRSYKEKALGFFKGFKTAVEESNPGFVFQNEPQSLVGKFVGVVLGEEEYRANSGEIKKRLYVDQTRSGQAIRAGDFAVPPLKKYVPQNSESAGAYDGFAGRDPFAGLVDDDGDLPF